MNDVLKPVSIILGGTFPHIRLIELLKSRGYYTVLLDYYDQPPAKKYADHHIKESTLDKDRVLEIAKELNANLVISTCIDQANVTACYVAEKMGLPLPYSYETSLRVSDKVLMKKIMVENSIPTAKHIQVDENGFFDEAGLMFPLVVKPSDSNSSKGVRKATNKEELQSFLDKALQISRNGKAIIEEYKTGREIGVDCYIQHGEAHIIMTRERRKIESDQDTIQQIYGSFWPADITEEVIIKFKNIANSIAAAFELDNTPLLIQAILSDNNEEINILEFAPRIGGGDNYRIIELSTGFDFVDAGIDSFLGNEVKLVYKKPEFILADNYIYVKPGKFGKLTNYQHLLDDKTIEYIKIYKVEGIELGGEISSNNRVGVFTVKSKTEAGILEKLDKANSDIQVYDIEGNPMMRKDIYTNLNSN